MGYVPEDDYLRKSVKKQRAVFEAFPRSKSAQAFANLADKANKWPMPISAAGHIEFFVERLIQPLKNKVEAV
jgi:flagellar biosynthesis protein FlhG